MKKIFIYALLLGALTLAGCGGDDIVVEGSGTTQEKPEGYDNLRDSVGTSTRPTDWQAVPLSQLDITSPDRIVLTSLELPVDIDLANDLMGAFVDGECRAVTSAVVEHSDLIHFTLIVMPKIDENLTSINIELRYFSAKNKRIYIAEPFAFSPGSMQHGTLTGGGYKAKWK